MADNRLAAAALQLTFTPKRARFFFNPCLDEEGDTTGYYRCKLCSKCRPHIPKTGYANLVSHLKAAYPTF
ncbi:hypothetical protein PF005_g5231 [Phytophthora fragariae]|uniref:BED-type domain-containing protein n=1 Tax=Phytophthora fragariae TaxID=53985 RepID=A0A6A3LYA9_9STRA|nr:hypothetical protein PF003_g2695 [Phytophthora fragariae]KAE8944773.1 hypothetical protein PF009_g5562 [Phytophthora fragariae]KAE9023040.1 hypothetical protein PF011_g4179 [Phytophthora fragariae]KAE9128503.1 hypothetical protein PF007_g5239 [Phytophthora fragariae]KAE9128647.1 hypothetical protein PF010_g4433 [Phytophthora fragariae]